MRDAVRVALLARPGAGGDRLREALRAAGADLVLDADPTTLEPETLAGAGAESVVVLLDSAVEEALDRLDPVLHDPAIDVLYEESEVAAAREGWDVARWTRHLSAKLLRHGDVLPPGREADGGADRGAAGEVVARVAPVPAAPVPAPAGTHAPSMFDPVSAEYDPGTFEATGADPSEPEPLALEAPDVQPPVPEVPDLAVPDLEMSDLEMSDLEPTAASPAMAAPDPEADDLSLTLALEDEGPAPPPAAPVASTPPPPPAPSIREGAPEAAGAPRSDAIRDFRRDLAGIEQRIASMGLVDVDPPPAPPAAEAPVDPATPVAPIEPATPHPPLADAPLPDAPLPDPATSAEDLPTPGTMPAQAPGAVLVFAGIGGPDAVRQFLGALPAGFPRPVLIHQRLDGGRHDRLVQQMARATSLPVQLAADNETVVAGHVYILPPELGLADDVAGLRFVTGSDPMAGLPAGESAILMFSGSDTALVEAAMLHASAGALVAGQSPEDCYDAAAADALVARGAESGQPADLARRLAERWAA